MVPLPAPNPNEPTARELDSRTSDGIHVQLVWHPQAPGIAVAVQDTKTGEAFEIAVGPGRRVLDVFHHPYAYAADVLAGVTTQA